jgi:hypothetical protein
VTRKTRGAPDDCGFGNDCAAAPPGSALTAISAPITAATVDSAGAWTSATGSSAVGVGVGVGSGVATGVDELVGAGSATAGPRPKITTQVTTIAAHTTTAAATMRIVRRRGTLMVSGTGCQPVYVASPGTGTATGAAPVIARALDAT